MTSFFGQVSKYRILVTEEGFQTALRQLTYIPLESIRAIVFFLRRLSLHLYVRLIAYVNG